VKRRPPLPAFGSSYFPGRKALTQWYLLFFHKVRESVEKLRCKGTWSVKLYATRPDPASGLWLYKRKLLYAPCCFEKRWLPRAAAIWKKK
jgi:hypothetical protein